MKRTIGFTFRGFQKIKANLLQNLTFEMKLVHVKGWFTNEDERSM